MGSGQSKPTVLNCMLKIFEKGFNGDYGIKMNPRTLKKLCEVEWPAFGDPLRKSRQCYHLLETIFQTQKPTWVDCKQLRFTFFNTEERMRVVSEARKWLQTQAPAGILDTDRWAREAFPDEEPDWSLNSEDGRARLERCRLAFLQGVRAGAKKPTNMAKISEVFQKPDETFYERLCEAYRIYTPFNPEALENQTMVNAAFVGQAQPDIRRKLQKLEGFAGKNATELLEIANKVFITRDSVARREEEKRIQRRANIIAAAFRGSGSQTDQKGNQEYRPGGKGKPSLRRDQCAYCKETGHWKNECPK
ncbi:hypothetical protein QTO34_009658 [Cnephaeus nilssonii]|uniref:CCHC-type domain-containing protein n=1 Tax=Cnephaeus nilssonii TaxID=3371016 RepID=A0AA40HJ39_CNENI|nr:hypothetical protein QTO34_009658 [Eptesicus nilssonii]